MTLLLIVCSQDLTLARLLLRRITRLGGWAWLSGVCLYLDNDLSEEEAGLFLGPELPPLGSDLRVWRDPVVDRWNSDRGGMALDAYRMALALGRDVLRLDLDLYIAAPGFFEALAPSRPGFAGKRLDFFLPSPVRGRPLCYIQGGVTRVGPKAAELILGLPVEEYRRRKRQPELFLELPRAAITPEHRRYFALVEDLCLSGVEAQLAGVERHDIPGLQVSPHEVVPKIEDIPGGAPALWRAFERSGALAYHYEGSQAGLHGRMLKYLKWAYEHAGAIAAAERR